MASTKTLMAKYLRTLKMGTDNPVSIGMTKKLDVEKSQKGCGSRAEELKDSRRDCAAASCCVFRN